MSETMDWSSPAPSVEPTTEPTAENQENTESSNEPESKENHQPTPRDNSDKSEDPKEPEPKKKAPRMIKVGDETISEDDLIKNYGKYKGADQKFREAAKARKQMESFVEQLKSDPMKVLQDKRLPIDRRKLAEEWLASELEAELEDPRDRKLREYEAREQAEQERLQQEEMTAKEKAEQEEFQQLIETRKTEIQNTLSQAMEMSALSKHPETAASSLREMALYMRAASEAGETITPEELAQHVESKRYKEYYSVVNSLDGDELINFLGEEVVGKLRKADLARLKGSQRPKPKAESSTSAPKESGFKTESPQDARDRLRKLMLD